MQALFETYPLSSARLSMAPTCPQHVVDVVLAPDQLQRIAIPPGARFVLFSFDGNFRAKAGLASDDLLLPFATGSDGSGSELNPAARRIPDTLPNEAGAPTHLLLRGPATARGSLSFYG